MGRRSYSEQLNPHQLALEHGRPIALLHVLTLLQKAANARQKRDHHETGAYLDAATLALRWFEDDLRKDVKMQLDVQTANLNAMVDRLVKPAAKAPNVNTTSSAAGAGVRTYANSAPSTSTPASGSYGNRSEPGGAGAGGGYAHTHQVPDAAAAAPNENCERWCADCGHALERHGPAGDCSGKGCECEEFREEEEGDE